MKEQSQKLARKHIKGGCYLKVTLVDRGLIADVSEHCVCSIFTGDWMRNPLANEDETDIVFRNVAY
jgi:hypothetical protein